MSWAEFLEPRRLLAFGDFDNAFGSGGHLGSDPNGAGTTFNASPYGHDQILVLPNGDSVSLSFDGVVGRKPNGSLDPSFGNAGLVQLPDGWETESLKLSGDDHLFVAIRSSTGDAFAKFSASGVLDTTYGSNGIASINSPRDEDGINNWGVTRGGTIYYTHGSEFNEVLPTDQLARMLSNGQIDSNFVMSGSEPAPPRRSKLHLTLQFDDPEVIVDSHDRVRLIQTVDWQRTDYSQDQDGEQTANTTIFQRYLAITAVNSRGHIDKWFGNAGVSYIPLATVNFTIRKTGINWSEAIQPGSDSMLFAIDDLRTDLVEMNSAGRIVSANVRYDGQTESFPDSMRWLADGSVVALAGFDIAIIAKASDGKWHVDPPIAIEVPPVSTDQISAIAPTSTGKLLIGGAWRSSTQVVEEDFQLEQIDLGTADDPALAIKTIPGGRENAAAVDSKGEFHLVYFNATRNELDYDFREPDGRWNPYGPLQVDFDTSNVRNLTMQIDPADDEPAIAYLDVQNQTLKFAKFDGTQWLVEPIATGMSAVDHPSMIFADDNTAWISYFDHATGELRFAHRTSQNKNGVGLWATETVDHLSVNAATMVWPSVGINYLTDRFSIAYSSPSGIKLAERQKGGAWQISRIDGTSAAAIDPQLLYLFVGGQGTFPTISYRDGKRHDIRYAARSFDEMAWTIDVVPNKSNVTDGFTREYFADRGEETSEEKLFWWDQKQNAVMYQEVYEGYGSPQFSTTDWRLEHAAYGGGQYLTVADGTLIYLDSASGNLVVSNFA